MKEKVREKEKGVKVDESFFLLLLLFIYFIFF
jgi:hypothetical protein